MSGDIEAGIREFILENFSVEDEASLTGDTQLMEQRIINSTGVLLLVMHIEDNFGFDVDEDDVVPENMNTINSIAAYIRRKQG